MSSCLAQKRWGIQDNPVKAVLVYLLPFQLADNMVKEIQEGIGETGVRCGVIGEIGCSYPLMDSEKKALQAAAMAQTRTGEGREGACITSSCRHISISLGAPLIIHPGREDESPFEIVSILEAAGADVGRTVMSHLDRTVQDKGKLLELAQLGCLMEYDLFGMECSHYQV